jgi:hypothetical protein
MTVASSAASDRRAAAPAKLATSVGLTSWRSDASQRVDHERRRRAGHDDAGDEPRGLRP